MFDKPYVIILAGVAGAGKTTVGKLLASRKGWDFLDADNFHSSENIEKMSSGMPLSEEDRKPWLEKIKLKIKRAIAGKKKTVIACSALKEKYREYLREGLDNINIFLLNIDYEEAYRRISRRKDHFFGAETLKSQFETLEKGKDMTIIDASKTPEAVADKILGKLTS